MLAALLWLAACDQDTLRPVWIGTVSPTSARAGELVHLLGHGLASATPASADAGLATPQTDQVLVDGQPVVIRYRADDRVDFIAPALAAGPATVIVLSGGTASNPVTLWLNPPLPADATVVP